MNIKQSALKWSRIKNNINFIFGLQSPMVQLSEDKLEQRNKVLKLSAKGSVALRRVLAAIDDRLEPITDTIEEKKRLINESLGLPIENPTPEQKLAIDKATAELNKEIATVMKEELELEIQPVSEGLLDIEAIPGDVLHALRKILVQ